ncbi:integron gene cassette protein [Xylariaceae sp. FL0804]|nr:integron gene cassette protein [Xylariaceae sp. FL0804]
MAAPGGMNLTDLIRSMQPVLDSETTYHFATIRDSSSPSSASPPSASPYPAPLPRLAQLPFEMLFREREGWTVIAPAATLTALGVAPEDVFFACRKITLNVHSSLEAVGFIAAVAAEVADLGVGVNPVSGFYHDHLFVPAGREQEVMARLRRMAERAGGQAPDCFIAFVDR